jgi:hypothetical protein
MIKMNDIKMEADYRGYQIKWNDSHGWFTVYKDDIDLKSRIQTLADCRKWIDQKEKQQFKRVPVLHSFRYWHEKQPCEATSIVSDHGYNYAWLVSGNERKKILVSDVWLDVPENRQALEEIKAKRQQIAQLAAEIEQIESATKRLTAEMMVE